MTSPANFHEATHRYQASCEGKQAHVSESAGWAALKFYNTHAREYRTSSAMDVYKCDFCPDWHIGHSSPHRATGRAKVG